MTDDTTIEIEEVAGRRVDVDRLRDLLTADPRIREIFADTDLDGLRILGPQTPVRDEEQAPFVATVVDATGNLAATVRGDLDRPEELDVSSTAVVPNPTREELLGALEVLRADEHFSPFARRDDVIVYQPMPPTSDVEQDDGTVVRRVTLGIFDPEGRPVHRFVAVDLGNRSVDWHLHGVEHLDDHDCEDHLPVGVGGLPGGDTGLGQVRVRVVKGGQELWSFTVVRPRDSAPTHLGKGSGVELRQVRYRGRLVLWQAHVPILNVLYDDGVTYRDWQNQETQFHAVGSDPVGPGWRVCSGPPATILESGTDVGNFQGVAFWYDDGELQIVSEMQAGWYRYISEWRLRDDGTIQPRFGFAGTRNPRTCMRHQHHVYWRLDFDIEGGGRDVVEQRGLILPWQPVWHRIVRETKRIRSPFAREWRVLDADSGRGYRITPGAADSSADAYGVADLWFLRYRGTELDDGVAVVGGPASATQVKLDQYLTGESIDRTDVVVWYAGHFLHDEEHPSPHQGHVVGPELRPVNW